MRIKKGTMRNLGILAFAVVALIAFTFIGIITISPDVASLPNGTMITFVNVTNTEPTVTDIVIKPDSPVTLSPGNITTITCNATVHDWNGYTDIRAINGTLFFSEGGFTINSDEDNNSHYTNSSCGSCTQFDANPTNASCTCAFAVQYYASNGTWSCNVTIKDIGGFLPTETPLNFTASGQGTVNISALIAIDTPSTLNFGNLTVSQTSTAKQVNITNLGNRDVNISLYGYGGDNETEQVNMSMVCPYGGNITILNERYSFENSPNFDAMFTFNTSARSTNITLAKVTAQEPLDQNNRSNMTNWKLKIPYSVGGYCNGTIVFIASDALY
ncbi:hypothetical protein HYU11_04685 [Candidatus Woesearchaeota archaeon]|nr:hypothetical protein [Candidatus Woesearchaeota archaeon]